MTVILEGATMEQVEGYYFLNQYGDLLFSRTRPNEKRVWDIREWNTQSAWLVAIEMKKAGVDPEKLARLMGVWGLTDENGEEFAKRAGLTIEKLEEEGKRVWFAAARTVPGKSKPVSQLGVSETLVGALAQLLVLSEARRNVGGRPWR